MNRYAFSDVFQHHPDGSLTPKLRISVNGIEFGPEVSFQPGISLGGVDFHKYKDMPIAGETKDGILIIKGIYQK